MKRFENISLKDKNTFGLAAKAKQYIAPESFDELYEMLNDKELIGKPYFILGGGSNLLFVNDFDGLIIHPQLFGKEIIEEEENNVTIKAYAAENWDNFVEWTVEHGFGGLENLSLIPGTVGACPVQNIGAYGVEVADVIEKVEAVEIETLATREFSLEECQFGYRNSVFKNELKNKYIITAVYFRLSKKPTFKIHYGAVEEELKKLGSVNLTTVRQAVINIRQSKLPDPESVPNAGSFFKNPVVNEKHVINLKEKFPDLATYPAGDKQFKIAAGWMIDKLGWKGREFKGAAVHDKQALVLINKNNATGQQIIELAETIRKDVYENFEVNLEFEVNIIGV